MVNSDDNEGKEEEEIENKYIKDSRKMANDNIKKTNERIVDDYIDEMKAFKENIQNTSNLNKDTIKPNAVSVNEYDNVDETFINDFNDDKTFENIKFSKIDDNLSNKMFILISVMNGIIKYLNKKELNDKLKDFKEKLEKVIQEAYNKTRPSVKQMEKYDKIELYEENKNNEKYLNFFGFMNVDKQIQAFRDRLNSLKN